MKPAYVFEIQTPKKFVLNGLWFGPPKPKRAIILVHGLFSSAFSMAHVVQTLVDAETAVITFNNRGHDTIADVKQIKGTKRIYHRAGTAHEVFTDCADDIEGVLQRVKKEGVQNIFLAGHSTGCQKITYFAHKKPQSSINGLILLAPLSDYAGDRTKRKLKKIVTLAQKLVKARREHELLPPGTWWHEVDAQRFLSLYTADSIEEMFTYAQPEKKPKIYSSVKIPILAIFADKDEYADRKTTELVAWFTLHTKSNRFAAIIVPRANHSFKEGGEVVTAAIREWLK